MNTNKVKVQIVPFLYSMEIRVFLLIVLSFTVGVIFSKITEYFGIKLFFEKLKDKKYLKTLEKKVKENEKK